MKKILSIFGFLLLAIGTWGQTTQFPLSTIINVSVISPSSGFQGYNTANLAIFSDDVYGSSFPATLGYQYYTSPTQVGLDFGTGSKTYQMANAVFSQNPNILAANGQLIVVAMDTATEGITLSSAATIGGVTFTWGGNSAAITYTDTASSIQTKLQELSGLSGVTVSGSFASQNFNIGMKGVYGESPALFTFTGNTLESSGSTPVTLTASIAVTGESLTDCLNDSISVVPYAGVIPNERYSVIGNSDFVTAGAAFQAQNVLLGIVGNSDADNQSTGAFYKNTQSLNTHTRCLTYFETASNDDLLFLAGYFSLLQSVDYTGSNTTLTMNLKQLNGVPVDDLIITGNDFTHAASAGSDIYISIMGVPGVISNGANLFADQITNRLWLTGAVQTAWFNTEAQTSTKIPQTEAGMNIFRNSVQQVLVQAVNNGYLAPGQWTLPNTFGNLANFYNNISQYGFYIYTQPVAQQSQTQRAGRISPLMQIAAKEAGAVQTGSVEIFLNP